MEKLFKTKYGTKILIPMDTYISRDIAGMSKGKEFRIQALADSDSSTSIISLDLAEQLKLGG